MATSLVHIAGTALANLIVWGLGALLYIADAQRRGAPLSSRTLLHIAGIGIPLFMASWIIGLTGLSWPVRALLAAVPGTLLVGTLLIQEPERRLVRRLVSARLSVARSAVITCAAPTAAAIERTRSISPPTRP